MEKEEDDKPTVGVVDVEEHFVLLDQLAVVFVHDDLLGSPL